MVSNKSETQLNSAAETSFSIVVFATGPVQIKRYKDARPLPFFASPSSPPSATCVSSPPPISCSRQLSPSRKPATAIVATPLSALLALISPPMSAASSRRRTALTPMQVLELSVPALYHNAYSSFTDLLRTGNPYSAIDISGGATCSGEDVCCSREVSSDCQARERCALMMIIDWSNRSGLQTIQCYLVSGKIILSVVVSCSVSVPLLFAPVPELFLSHSLQSCSKSPVKKRK